MEYTTVITYVPPDGDGNESQGSGRSHGEKASKPLIAKSHKLRLLENWILLSRSTFSSGRLGAEEDEHPLAKLAWEVKPV